MESNCLNLSELLTAPPVAGDKECPECVVGDDECIILEPARPKHQNDLDDDNVLVLKPAAECHGKKGLFASVLEEVVGTTSESGQEVGESCEVVDVSECSAPETENVDQSKDVSEAVVDSIAVDPNVTVVDAIEEDIVEKLMADIESEMVATGFDAGIEGGGDNVAATAGPQKEIVPDGLPLTEAALSNVGAPHGIVFDGVLVRSVNSWKDCYLALCEKLMAIDMSKFDGLPKNPFFKRFFIRAIPHKKYPDCYSVCCGTSGDVRIKTLSAGFYFYKPKYIVSQLLELYGIDPARVTIKV